jgi:hypothetical protein
VRWLFARHNSLQASANNTQLSKESFKSVRLVNKTWGVISASVLWQKFTTDLVETPDRRLSALLSSHRGGFGDHVKKLYIKDPDIDQRTKSDLAHLRLLSAFSVNSLTQLDCPSRMDRTTVSQFISKQAQLIKLAVNMYEEDEPCGPPDVNFITGQLDHLLDLTINVHNDEHHSYKEYGIWFKALPRLQELFISGLRRRHHNNFNGFVMPVGTPLLDLRTLRFFAVEFPDTPTQFPEQLRLLCLKTLSIRHCQNTGSLLDVFAQSLAASEETSLRAVSHTSEKHTGRMSGTEHLLESVAGLEVHQSVHCGRRSTSNTSHHATRAITTLSTCQLFLGMSSSSSARMARQYLPHSGNRTTRHCVL